MELQKMKTRKNWILAAAVLSWGLSVPVIQAQTTQNTPSDKSGTAQQSQTSAQTQPSAQTQSGTQTQPSSQTAPSDQAQTSSQSQTSSQDQAGSQTPAASQTPEASDQSSSSNDQNADKDKKDKKKDKKDKDKDKDEHHGGKNDVDAIGNRDIGKRGLGDWYSIEKEVRMGKEFAQQVEASVKLVNDPVVNEYVNRIGQNLVRNSDAKVPFTIKVVDDDTINAFALPGGFFYVDSGLILAADDESELAGVMAHEIAHVCARHAMRQMTRGNIANIATIPLIFVGGGLGYGVRQAAGIGLPLTFMSFSRGFEAEADYLGTQYLYKTGYDPNGLVTMFEKIDALQKKKPGTLSKAFSSHPQTPDRIEKTQDEIAKILPAKDQYVVTTSEFDSVKARLAALENRRKLTDQKDDGKPSLRRANNDKDKTDKDKNDKGDDDRPTLKKRDDQ
jgi:beta-barrel assembly-enhancing protease